MLINEKNGDNNLLLIIQPKSASLPWKVAGFEIDGDRAEFGPAIAAVRPDNIARANRRASKWNEIYESQPTHILAVQHRASPVHGKLCGAQSNPFGGRQSRPRMGRAVAGRSAKTICQASRARDAPSPYGGSLIQTAERSPVTEYASGHRPSFIRTGLGHCIPVTDDQGF